MLFRPIAIEVGQVISTHLTMTHTSPEGANLVSRGIIANDALDAIYRVGGGYFQDPSNQANWKIIYSKVTQDITVPCPNPPTTPCTYRIDEAQTVDSLAGCWLKTVSSALLARSTRSLRFPESTALSPGKLSKSSKSITTTYRISLPMSARE